LGEQRHNLREANFVSKRYLNASTLLVKKDKLVQKVPCVRNFYIEEN
jgi:hypothetical protein